MFTPVQKRLDQKVAIVTGAGRGIGRGIAIRLAGEGAAVVVTNRTTSFAEETVDLIREAGGTAIPMTVDARSADQIDEMVGRTIDAFGRIDILVSNAGVNQARPWREITEDEWISMFRLHVLGYYHGAKAVAPHMLARQQGRIIVISSSGAWKAAEWAMHYAACKAAQVNMTRTLAAALAPHGITANAICPGLVHTELNQGMARDIEALGGFGTADEIQAGWLVGTPVGRGSTPEELAGMVAYLASDEAGFVTGQAIDYNGGSIMR